MHITTQFSIFMVNKPGVLAQILGEFARAKINIVAMTMMDTVEHGVMRVVFDSPSHAREVLSKLNMPCNETDVLCVNLANKAGALAAVAEKLAVNHINISYAYCTAGAQGGRATGILKIADVKKAMRILEGGETKKQKTQAVIRRSQSSRK
jgi:hypothetical protein